MELHKLWKKILCYLSHDWETTLDGGECVGTWFNGNVGIRVCKRCGLTQRNICDDCTEHGVGACLDRMRQTYQESRRTRNCCVHCPKTDHNHE